MINKAALVIATALVAGSAQAATARMVAESGALLEAQFSQGAAGGSREAVRRSDAERAGPLTKLGLLTVAPLGETPSERHGTATSETPTILAAARRGGAASRTAVHRGGAVRRGGAVYRGGTVVRRGGVAVRGPAYYGAACGYAPYPPCAYGAPYYGGAAVYRGGAVYRRGGAVYRGGARVSHHRGAVRGGGRRR